MATLPLSPEGASQFMSLSARIAQARERAEGFASRHQQHPLESHNENMLAIEKERQKWAKMYQEKSVIIEQLERELGTTVETLHHKGGIGTNNGSLHNISMDKDTKLSPGNSIDLLNFTDALRKENSSIKLSFTHMVEKKTELEVENQMLRMENASMKIEIDDLKKTFTKNKDRWLKQDTELNSMILALESQVIALRANSLTNSNSKNDVILKETQALDIQEKQQLHSERDANLKLLNAAREEIAWLRDLLRNKVKTDVPDFSMDIASTNAYSRDVLYKRNEESYQTMDSFVISEPIMPNKTTVAVAKVVDKTSPVKDILSGSFDDIERTIARAQQTKRQLEELIAENGTLSMTKDLYTTHPAITENISNTTITHIPLPSTFATTPNRVNTAPHEDMSNNNITLVNAATQSTPISWIDDNSSYNPSVEGLSAYRDSLSAILASSSPASSTVKSQLANTTTVTVPVTVPSVNIPTTRPVDIITDTIPLVSNDNHATSRPAPMKHVKTVPSKERNMVQPKKKKRVTKKKQPQLVMYEELYYWKRCCNCSKRCQHQSKWQ